MKSQKKDFIWNLLGLTFNSFNSLFFLILVNRINGLTVVGEFSLCYAIACLLYVVSIYFNRSFQLSEENYTSKDYIVYRYVTAFTMFLLSLILCSFFKTTFERLLLILLCFFRNIEAIADVYYGEFHRNQMLSYAGKSMFLKAFLGIICFSLIDYYTKNLVGSIVALIGVNLLLLIVDIIKCRRFIKASSLNIQKLICLFKASSPIFLFSFISILLINVQKYILPAFDTKETIGLFSIIIMPGTMMSLCGQYLINPFVDDFKKAYRNEEFHRIKLKLYSLLMTLFILSLLFSILLITVGIPILNYIYNMQLESYRTLLFIIMLASGFYAMSTVISSVLTIMKQNKIQLKVFAFSTIVSVLLSCLAIKRYSIDGAVISFCFTMFLLLSLYLYSFMKILKKEREKI